MVQSELEQWQRVWAFLRPQRNSFGVRAHGTLSLLVDGARKTAIHLRTEGQGLGGWTDGQTAPQRPSLGALAATNLTVGTPSVPGPPNVYKQMKTDYYKQ